MITAVDTSVLIDVFVADPTFGARSKEVLRMCLAQGYVLACDVVWAEVVGVFPSDEVATQAMHRLEVGFAALDAKAARAAGTAWRGYRARGGRRERVIADFLIGAHAQAHADRLLTRDRGFYRTHFENLTVIDPSERPSKR